MCLREIFVDTLEEVGVCGSLLRRHTHIQLRKVTDISQVRKARKPQDPKQSGNMRERQARNGINGIKSHDE